MFGESKKFSKKSYPALVKNLTLRQPSWILYDHLFQTCFLKMNVIQSIEILYAYRFSHTGDTQESFRRYCLNEKKKLSEYIFC